MIGEEKERGKDFDNNFYVKVFNSIQEGISILDTNSTIIEVNEWMKKHYSDRLPLVGKKCYKVYQNRNSKCSSCPVKKCVKEMKQVTEIVPMKDSNGTKGWIELSAFPIFDENQEIQMVIEVLKEVTERIQNQRRLEKLNQRLELILKTSKIGTWDWDIQNNKIDFDKTWMKNLGYSTDDLNKGIKHWETLVHPNDLERVKREINKHLQGKTERYKTVHRIKTKNGNYRWVLDSGKVLKWNEQTKPLRAIGTYQDVTQTMIARGQLKKTTHLLHKVFQSSPNSIIVTNPQMEIIDFNKETMHLVEADTKEQLMGLNAIKLISPEQRNVAIEKTKQTLKSGKVKTIEYTLQTLKGNTREIELSASLLKQGKDKPIGFVAICIDITKRKKLESAMRQTQKWESLGRLAGGIAHDINNLMTGVIGNAELALMDAESNSETSAYLENILKCGNQVSKVSNQLLSYSGKNDKKFRVINLNEIIKNMRSMIKVSISEEVNLSIELEPKLPNITGDTAQINQAILNLVTNASEALGGQPGNIIIKTRRKILKRNKMPIFNFNPELKPGEYVCLEIIDDGLGIPQENIYKIFDPFYTTKFTGRGLGLAVVLGIINGHQGSINVNSIPEKRTTFKLYFPVATERINSFNTEEITTTPSPINNQCQGILLVDDEEQVRKVGKNLLAQLGFRVYLAENGKTGLNEFRSHQKDICCAIVDLTMPIMDGKTMIKKLKEINPELPVVLSTGYSEHNVGNFTTEYNNLRLLKKPYSFIELKQLLSQVIES